MDVWRVRLVLTVTVFTTFLALSGSLESAYAADVTLSDQTSCENNLGDPIPGIGGTWNAATSTCSKTNNLNIRAGDSLTIPSGVTLEFSVNRDLRNDGTITNNGEIYLERRLINRNTATFTNFGLILFGDIGGGLNQLNNRNSATFTNFGTLTIVDGDGNSSNRIQNVRSAIFTNSGTITITGGTGSGSSNRIQNQNTFTNTGTITIDGGPAGSSIRINNPNSGTFTNEGSITLDNELRNRGIFTNSGSLSADTDLDNRNGEITNTGTMTFDNDFNNRNGVLTNSGSFSLGNDLDNRNGEITNTGTMSIGNDLTNNGSGMVSSCITTITITGTFSGNAIIPLDCPEPLQSRGGQPPEGPTLGTWDISGQQVVENGFCFDADCITVTSRFHQEVPKIDAVSGIHTISLTILCEHGFDSCTNVGLGMAPIGPFDFNQAVWKLNIERTFGGDWELTVDDPDDYIGDVTFTVQVIDNKYLAVSFTIDFKKPTGTNYALGVPLGDYRIMTSIFWFNEGIEITDRWAYPTLKASYEEPMDIPRVCKPEEDSTDRITCTFASKMHSEIKKAEAVFEKITSHTKVKHNFEENVE